MADPVVHITNGIPDTGTGNITTLGQTLIDGANFTLGSSTDPAVAAGAVGTMSAKLRSISRDIIGGIVLQTGANTIGSVNQGTSPWVVSGSVSITGTATVSGTVAATQSGTWNINNISGTISLPTGAATAAKQPALGIAGTPSADVITVQGVTGMTALKVDGSAVTQPISGNVGITGTVNAAQSGTWNVGITGTVSVVQGGNFTTRIVGNGGNVIDFSSSQNQAAPAGTLLVGAEFNTVPTTITNGNASPLQMDSSANLLVNVKTSALPSGAATSANQASAAALGSTTSGQTGTLALGAVTSASPAYTTGQTNALSLDTAGSLRVAIISGAGSGGTASNFGSAFPGSGTAIGVKDSAGTNMTFLKANASNALVVDGSAVTQPVSGTFWQATQPVSGTVSVSGTVTVTGTVTSNQGGAPWTMKPDGTVWTLTSTSANVNVTNTVPVSGTFWQATQPVSGTITANQGGTWNITNISGTISLPTGAATSANQPTAAALGSTTSGQTGNLGLGAVTSAAPTYTTATTNALSLTTSGALRVDNSAVTQPVSGTITANQGGTWSVRNLGNAGAILDFAGQNASSPANAFLIGGQFNTTPTTITNGNSSPLQLDSAGNLRVNIMAGAGSGGTASTIGSAIPSQGTAAGFSDGTNMQLARVFDADTGAGFQYVLGAYLRKPASGGSVDFGTSTDPIRVDVTGTTTQPVSGTFWQATQPVSGTLTVTQSTAGNLLCTASQGGTWNINNISGTVSLPTGAATSANQPSNAAQGSTTSGQTGNLAMGAVTTGNPTYTTAQTSPLSLDTSGALRVNVIAGSGGGGTSSSFGSAFPSTGTAIGAKDSAGTNMTFLQVNASNALKVDGSAVTQPVSGTFWQATQPVSGTVTATQSTASSLLCTASQGGTWTVQPGNTANTTPWLFTINQGGNSATVSAAGALKVDGSAVTQPVSGTITANIGTSGSLALESGGNLASIKTDVDNLNLAQGSTTAGQKGNLGLGAVTTAAPSYTTAQSSPLSLTTSGLLRVDGSGVTQPVSGTFWQATQPVSIAAAVTVAQSTAANLLCTASQGGTWTVQPGNTANTTAWLVTGTGGTFPVTQATASNLKAQVDPLTPASWAIGTSTQNSATVANGNLALAQFNTTPTTITSGNMSPLQMDSAGNLLVNIKAGAGSGGTASSFGAAFPATGTAAGANVVSSAPTYTAGNMNGLTMSTAGRLIVDGSQVTQPVSGTVTVAQSIATNLNAMVNLSATMPNLSSPAATWTSATGLNAAVTIGSSGSNTWPTIVGQLTQGTTLTAGAVTFEESYDSGTTYVAIPAGRLINPATGAQISNPYTFQASTNLPFEIVTTGAQYIRGRLSTVITGTGNVVWALAQSQLSSQQLVFQPTAANLQVTARNVGNAGGIFDFASTQNVATPAQAILTGGEFNTTPTTITNGNSSPLQLDSTGSLLVNVKTSTSISANQGTSPWHCDGQAASGVSVAGIGLMIPGWVAQTSNPTAVTGGQAVNPLADKLGKLVTVGALRDLKAVQTTTITSASETTVITAGAAGVFNDVYGIVCSNTSATAVNVAFKDATAGTTRVTLMVPAGDVRGMTLPVDSAMVQAVAANNWTATVSTGVTSILITMLYVKNT